MGVKSMKEYLFIAAGCMKNITQDEIGFSDIEKTYCEIWASIKVLFAYWLKIKKGGMLLKN